MAECDWYLVLIDHLAGVSLAGADVCHMPDDAEVTGTQTLAEPIHVLDGALVIQCDVVDQ